MTVLCSWPERPGLFFPPPDGLCLDQPCGTSPGSSRRASTLQIAEEHLCLIRSPLSVHTILMLSFFFYKGSLRLSAPQCRCHLWAPRGSSRATAPPWAPLFPCSARPNIDWLGAKWCVSWTTTTLTGRGRRTVNVSRNRKPLPRERRLFAAVGCCINESNCL